MSFPRAGGKMGRDEITPLAIEAKKAFGIQADHGLIDSCESFNDWRRRQVAEATGGRAAGLSTATHGQFRSILAHFLALQGRDVESYQASMRTGAAMKSRPSRGAAPAHAGEQIEDREQAATVFDRVLQETGYHLSYAEAVSNGRFGTRRLDSLDARQLMDLVFTLRNRAHARDGKGSSRERNKAQRRKTTRHKTQGEHLERRSSPPSGLVS